MNSIQQQHLQQLGLPVWRLREPETSPSPTAEASPKAITISWQNTPVGSCLADHDADKTLLEAMLNATQCSWTPTEDDIPEGLTVIFGLNLAQTLLPAADLSEANLNTLLSFDSEPVIITHAVNAIAADPSLKKPAWEALKIAMAYWKGKQHSLSPARHAEPIQCRGNHEVIPRDATL